ncbi:MAG: guanylate kinase [Candidatus Cloacimonetes bacterium]|nr:guanylate kinase [Candidatus Cloacimonadota bacterium]
MTTGYSKRNFLIILSAPSGGGKSTIKNEILEKSEKMEYSVSYTTRAPRGSEKDEVDYFFVTENKFLELKVKNEFLESALVHGNWYGTSRSFIESKFNQGKHVIMDIDIQGAESIRKSDIDSVSIFILPPDLEILEKRLRDRGTDNEESIRKRLYNARKEIEKISDYEYLVINDDLNDAVTEIEAIIKAEENKVKRYNKIESKFYGG